MTNNDNKIEMFNGESLHPSLDIKDGILVIGFRYRSKQYEEKEIFLVVNNGNIEVVYTDSFTAYLTSLTQLLF